MVFNWKSILVFLHLIFLCGVIALLILGSTAAASSQSSTRIDATTDFSLCAQPDLSIKTEPESTFWASYSDYIARRLSVGAVISNLGAIPANNTRIIDSSSTRGADLITELPVGIGDVPANGSSMANIKYHVPPGVTVFSTTNILSAEDICGYSYTFPLQPSYQVHGLDFSPFIDGQDPNVAGTTIGENQIRQRLEIVQPYTEWVRTYSTANGLEKTGKIAHECGLKTAIGAWLGADGAANETQIANLIDAANNGQADLVIVGNEAMSQQGLTEQQLISYIQRVKTALPGVKIATSEIYSVFIDHPELIAAVDVVMANYYPYWEGVSVADAIPAIHDWHHYLSSLSPGKEVMVSETGWPSAGSQLGAAVPSLENANRYFVEFVSWARANNVPYFYFESMDESWKASREGPQGAHWGVWDKNGQLKGGMQQVFQNTTVSDTWSGPPAIELTSIPAYGTTANLYGRAWHVIPPDYRVLVYIKVAGGWWNKPTWSQPATTINSNGSWMCDITTGGSDQNATEIAVYLVPASFSAPLVQGSISLPAALDANAVAATQVTRSS